MTLKYIAILAIMVMMLIPAVTLTAFAEVVVEYDQLYIYATDEEGEPTRPFRFMNDFEYGIYYEPLNIWKFVIMDDGIKGNGYQMMIDRNLTGGDILPRITIQHFNQERISLEDTYTELVPALYDCEVLEFHISNNAEVEQLLLLVRC